MATVIDDSIGSRAGGFGGLGDRGCDGDGGHGNNPFVAAILSNLNNIATSIPTTALETQGTINNGLASLALGTQQGFSNVKDSVQVTGTANLVATNNVNQSVLTSALQTAIAIGDDGDKTRALIQSINNADLNRQLAVAESALLEERGNRRIRDVEVNISQTVSQNNLQAQAQLQQQQQAQFMAGILAEVRNLAGDIQAVKQGQVIFNSGAMTAAGNQTAANTKVA